MLRRLRLIRRLRLTPRSDQTTADKAAGKTAADTSELRRRIRGEELAVVETENELAKLQVGGTGVMAGIDGCDGVMCEPLRAQSGKAAGARAGLRRCSGTGAVGEPGAGGSLTCAAPPPLPSRWTS